MTVPRRIGARKSIECLLAGLLTSQHSVFTRQQANELGVSTAALKHAVVSGRVERVYRGVYRMTTAQPCWQQDVMAACLLAGEGSCASHRSAGRLWELDGVGRAPIEVSTERDVRLSLPNITLYRVTSLPVSDVVRDVIPVTRPARTLIDLAGVLHPQQLELALDCALRRRLITVSRMRWQLDHFGTRGRPGAGPPGRPRR